MRKANNHIQPSPPETAARREKVFRMRAAEGLDIAVIADRCGVHERTIRTDLKWLARNGYDLGADHRRKSAGSKAIAAHAVSDSEAATRINKKLRALEMRRQGRSIPDIARTLELAYRTAQAYIEEALKECVTREVDLLRQLECQRLDEYLEKLKPRIDRGDEKAVNAALRVSEQRARLLGLNAPIRVEGTFHEETEQDRELQEMIREAQARNAVEKDRIAAAPPPESTLLQ